MDLRQQDFNNRISESRFNAPKFNRRRATDDLILTSLRNGNREFSTILKESPTFVEDAD